jgi:hypothetical protein
MDGTGFQERARVGLASFLRTRDHRLTIENAATSSLVHPIRRPFVRPRASITRLLGLDHKHNPT